MFGPRALARPLLAAPFVLRAVNVLRAPGTAAENSEQIDAALAGRLGLPTDPVALARLTAGVQIGGGALLALGVFPRTASLALAASLVPSMLSGHQFWRQHDHDRRREQMAVFADNAGLLGGLLLSALDTGSRPSVFWSGRRAAVRAAESVGDVAHTVAGSVGSAYHSLPSLS